MKVLRHLTANIDALLQETDEGLSFMFAGVGAEIRADLLERKAAGEVKIGSVGCEGFDPVTGCPGHPQEETKPDIKLEYFGTGYDTAGHYSWLPGPGGKNLVRSNIDLRLLPFHPDCLISPSLIKGTVKYLAKKDFRILAIAGSCADDRPGSVSIFYTNYDKIRLSQLKDLVLSIPAYKEIIDRMPFIVHWDREPVTAVYKHQKF